MKVSDRSNGLRLCLGYHLAIAVSLAISIDVATPQVSGQTKHQHQLSPTASTLSFPLNLKEPGLVKAVILPSPAPENDECFWSWDYRISRNGVAVVTGDTGRTGDGVRVYYETRLELLPAGSYEFEAKPDFQAEPDPTRGSPCVYEAVYEVTVDLINAKDVTSSLNLNVRHPIIDIYKESLLLDAIIESELDRFVNVRSVEVAFLDGLAARSNLATIVSAACQQIRTLKAKNSPSTVESNRNELLKDRYRLILSYAMGEIIGERKERRDSFFIEDQICEKNSLRGVLAKLAIPEILVKFSIRRDLSKETVDQLIDTRGSQSGRRERFVARISEADQQLIVTKMAMLLKRIFGVSPEDIIFEYRAGCSYIIRNGDVRQRRFRECYPRGSSTIVIPIDTKIAPGDVKGAASVNAASVTKARIEDAARDVFGAKTKDFLINGSHLFRIKIKARQLIIKSHNYWELVYLHVIPSEGSITAIIDAYYVSGLTTAPPPDRSFNRVTEIDFSRDITSALEAFSAKLSGAVP